MYPVVELFKSINGEGKKSGEIAVFIRFKGCNLKCIYCDTKWANESEVDFQLLSKEEILDEVKKTGIKNVTLTGGEPLLQDNILELITLLIKNNFFVEIETNGSIDLKPYLKDEISFTMDYKSPSSLMEEYMYLDNLKLLKRKDTIKFVVGSIEDLKKMKSIILKNELINKCSIFVSPVFGKISLEKIVNFLLKYKLNNVRMQLQMHKIIWDKDKKGV